MEPLSLRNQSIIFVAHRTYNKNLDDIIDHILLPDEIVRAIRTVHDELSAWKSDMHLIEVIAAYERPPDVQDRTQLDLIRILQLDILGRDKHVIRWTESSAANNSTIELDRLATARRLLANYEPNWYSPFVNDVAFTLASMFCLEDHVQRIWPHSSRLAFSIDYNAAVAYWSQRMLGQVVESRQTLQNLVIGRPKSAIHLSLDRCYASLRAFWPIIVREFGQFPGVDIVAWLRAALMESFGYESAKRVRSFLWEQIPADSIALLISNGPPCYVLLRAMLDSRQDEKFVEIWTSLDVNTRRKSLSTIRTSLEVTVRRSRVMKVPLDGFAQIGCVIRTMVINRFREPWIDEFVRDASWIVTKIWKSLGQNPDERSRRFRAPEYASFVPLIANEVSRRNDITALWNESSDDQRTQILVGDSCAAFRNASKLHRLEVMKFLWEKATLEQQQQLITQGDFEAFTSALERGRTPILKFLWENMDALSTLELIELQKINDAKLSRLICTADDFFALSLRPAQRLAINTFPRQRLEELFSILTMDPRPDGDEAIPLIMKSIFFDALMLDDGKAFRCLYRRARDGGNPELLVSLLSVFDQERKSRLRTIMSARQARLCGYAGVQPYAPWVDEEDSLDYS